MSDSTIRAGDPVEIVFPTLCGCADRMHETFVVTLVRPAGARLHCLVCGQQRGSAPGELVAEGHGPFSVNVRRLRKVDGSTRENSRRAEASA